MGSKESKNQSLEYEDKLTIIVGTTVRLYNLKTKDYETKRSLATVDPIYQSSAHHHSKHHYRYDLIWNKRNNLMIVNQVDYRFVVTTLNSQLEHIGTFSTPYCRDKYNFVEFVDTKSTSMNLLAWIYIASPVWPIALTNLVEMKLDGTVSVHSGIMSPDIHAIASAVSLPNQIILFIYDKDGRRKVMLSDDGKKFVRREYDAVLQATLDGIILASVKLIKNVRVGDVDRFTLAAVCDNIIIVLFDFNNFYQLLKYTDEDRKIKNFDDSQGFIIADYCVSDDGDEIFVMFKKKDRFQIIFDVWKRYEDTNTWRLDRSNIARRVVLSDSGKMFCTKNKHIVVSGLIYVNSNTGATTTSVFDQQTLKTVADVSGVAQVVNHEWYHDWIDQSVGLLKTVKSLDEFSSDILRVVVGYVR